MKKLLMYGVGAIVVVIIACMAFGGNEPTITKKGGNASSTQESSGESSVQAKVGDTVKVDNIEYTVKKVSIQNSRKDEMDYTSHKPELGQFIVVEFDIKNVGKETAKIDLDVFKLKDEDGAEYSCKSEISFDVTSSTKHSFIFEEINPNGLKRASFAFDVPNKDLSKYTFIAKESMSSTSPAIFKLA